MGKSAKNLKSGKVIVEMDITSAKDKVILFFGKAIGSAYVRLFRQRFRGQFLSNVTIHPDRLVIIDISGGKSRKNLNDLTTHLDRVCTEEGFGSLKFVQVDHKRRRVA